MPKLLAAILFTLPLLCQAEVYKWVDAKGVVHYSDNKYEAENASVAELKVNGPATPAPAGPTWQQRDAEFRRLQQLKLTNPGYRPRIAEPAPVPKQASYRGGKVDTDASRCDMARDIINGKLTLTNGLPIDAHGRQTAENDIRSFCR
ncbi:DUF4124 domain-containing protein [Duganella sp. CT11-25]|jgi:hypothetical protein|uniref:DUF4124 domain-containing protein n=1 Tax=unclassified Duganella TaxID=2636909 RepID=UPI0039AF2663